MTEEADLDATVKTYALAEATRFRKSTSRKYFYFTMSVMLDAGLNIVKALEILGRKDLDRSYQEFSEKALGKLMAGKVFAQTIDDFPFCFPKSDQRTIKAGENAGNLSETLASLAEVEESRIQIRRKLKTALIYPGFVVMVALLLLVAPALIFGDIKSVFLELGVDFPPLLEAILQVSRVCGTWQFWVCVGGLFFFFYQELQEERANAWFRKHARKAWTLVPGFSQLILLSSNAQFCRSLGAQIEVGVDLDKALRAALLAPADPLFEAQVDTILNTLHNGADLNTCLKDSDLFVPTVTAFVECGENTGELPKTLEAAAAYLDILFEARLRITLELVEPILLILTGLFVGGMAISTLLPLVQALNI